MIIALKVIVILFLVFLNGFFVASEFAIVKIRETRLVELAEAGNLRARVAEVLVSHLDAYLSATQLGITIASLGLGWLGEPMVSHQLEPLLYKLGIESETVVTTISVATGFTIITFLHIVFGELAPKSLAIQQPESTTLWISIPLRFFYWMLFPAIWVLNNAAIGSLKLMGIRPASEKELAHSEAELKMILSESARGGHISEQEKAISGRALRLADLKVRQVMVPRNEVIYFSLDEDLDRQLAKARRHNFARYPLCETGLESVAGMIHIRDVFWMMREGLEFNLKSIAHEIIVVSEEDSLEYVLRRFRDSHLHMAMVTDDQGAVSGVITLEDVLEQLVGQIQDEFDKESPWLKRIDEGIFEVAGRTPLTWLNERVGLDFGENDVVTLSGYITDRLGRFATAGDEIEVDGWKIMVIKTDALKVSVSRLERLPA